MNSRSNRTAQEHAVQRRMEDAFHAGPDPPNRRRAVEGRDGQCVGEEHIALDPHVRRTAAGGKLQVPQFIKRQTVKPEARDPQSGADQQDDQQQRQILSHPLARWLRRLDWLRGRVAHCVDATQNPVQSLSNQSHASLHKTALIRPYGFRTMLGLDFREKVRCNLNRPTGRT